MCGLFNLKHVSPGDYHHTVTENSYPTGFYLYMKMFYFQKERSSFLNVETASANRYHSVYLWEIWDPTEPNTHPEKVHNEQLWVKPENLTENTGTCPGALQRPHLLYVTGRADNY